MAIERKNKKATISMLVEASEKNTVPAEANTPPVLGEEQVVRTASDHAQPTAAQPGHQADARQTNAFISVLPALRNNNMLVPGSPLGQSFQDEYRRIKRPLLSNAIGRSSSLVDRGNLIMVTSSMPGEGKSYTATNLALSIAREKDVTVLLIDCDVARRGVSRLLGIEDRPGLVDLVDNEELTVADVMLTTDIPNFRVLAAGSHYDYVTELLASNRMASLVDEIATRYSDRIVIFDSPPLLATPETQVLATLVGQIVFVVETGKTPQAVVMDALEQLPEDKAIGIVLNKNEGASGKSGYYYGYYGADGSDASDK